MLQHLEHISETAAFSFLKFALSLPHDESDAASSPSSLRYQILHALVSVHCGGMALAHFLKSLQNFELKALLSFASDAMMHVSSAKSSSSPSSYQAPLSCLLEWSQILLDANLPKLVLDASVHKEMKNLAASLRVLAQDIHSLVDIRERASALTSRQTARNMARCSSASVSWANIISGQFKADFEPKKREIASISAIPSSSAQQSMPRAAEGPSTKRKKFSKN